MSQEKTLPPLPESTYQMGGKGHSDAAMSAYGERCIAAHLERTGQSVTNDAAPTLFQCRYRRISGEHWDWSAWKDCSSQLADIHEAVPEANDYRFEVRRLYLHPATPPDLLEAAQAAWNCIAELAPTQARVEVAQLLQAAIEKAIGEQP